MVEKGCEATVMLLAEKGADVGIEDKEVNSPLDLAVFGGHNAVYANVVGKKG